MKRIEMIRKSKGIQKQEITAAVGLDRAAYSCWRKGKPRLTVDQLVGICERLGVDAVETFSASKNDSENKKEVRELEKNPTAIDRRKDLPKFPLATAFSKNVFKIPRWENLAAGYGDDLEQSDEYTYVRELPDWHGVHSLIIRGDSMEKTLFDKDLILVEKFPGRPFIEMPPRGTGMKTSRLQWESKIQNDKLYVLAIGYGEDENFSIEPGMGPTVKRIRYEGSTDWTLYVDADNGAHTWKSKSINARQSVRFYAKVMGIGEGQYAKRK